jgi:uncharacterized protein (DUF952 family)/uncharacterized protein (DUF1330 family)
MLIYKIFRAPEWQALETEGRTRGAPVDLADGFIHFSTAEQVVETAAKHFAGIPDLVLAAIDPGALGEALRWEPSRGGAMFPHLYAELDRGAVAWHAPLPLHAGAHLFPEPVTPYVDPTESQLGSFSRLPVDKPFEMLNLIRLRGRAVYPQGHPLAAAVITGAEAYARYTAETMPILARFGGRVVWRGTVQAVVTGPDREAWDHAFVVRQNSAQDLLQMAGDPEYRAALVHRTAAVRTSRLIRCAPADPDAAFG